MILTTSSNVYLLILMEKYTNMSDMYTELLEIVILIKTSRPLLSTMHCWKYWVSLYQFWAATKSEGHLFQTKVYIV